MKAHISTKGMAVFSSCQVARPRSGRAYVAQSLRSEVSVVDSLFKGTYLLTSGRSIPAAAPAPEPRRDDSVTDREGARFAARRRSRVLRPFGTAGQIAVRSGGWLPTRADAHA